MNQARVDSGIVIALDGDEGQLVVEALAECPFKTVFELIGRLNRQANGAPAGAACQFVLSRADLGLIVGALVKLPYHRVHLLMRKLEQQVDGQPQSQPSRRKRKSA